MFGDNAYTEKTFQTADGLNLAFRDYGSRISNRTPILCLAGLTRNAKDFHDLACSLSTERRVLALDSRGRGKSDHDRDYENYSLVREAGDALSLLSIEIGRPAIIVGTSRGGLLSLVIHGVRADLIAGIVLNDIGPELEIAGLQRIVGYLGIKPNPLRDWTDAVAAMKSSNQSTFPKLTDEQWMCWAKRSFREVDGGLDLDYDPKLRDAVLEAPPQGADFWPQFRRVGDTPMLLLRGEHSDLLSPETVQAMRRSKPDMRAVTVRGRGHVPFLDEPESMEAINAFLAEVDQPPSS